MRIGLFGGSFDPVHWGHVRPLRAARAELALDRVIYLPTAVPPHKAHQQEASALRRYCMVELAVLAEEGLEVSDHELTLDREAYTVETLEHFSRALPEAELSLIVGADSLATLHLWRRWRDLAALARLIVLARPGWRRAAQRAAALEAIPDSGFDVVTAEVVDASSTRIRELLRHRDVTVAELLPGPVLDYIRKYRLYE